MLSWKKFCFAFVSLFVHFATEVSNELNMFEFEHKFNFVPANFVINSSAIEKRKFLFYAATLRVYRVENPVAFSSCPQSVQSYFMKTLWILKFMAIMSIITLNRARARFMSNKILFTQKMNTQWNAVIPNTRQLSSVRGVEA